MEHLQTIGLLESDGQPFDPRIQRVLIQLLPRLRREFPALQDDVGLAESMEEAGRRIRHREERGPIERLHGYAWSQCEAFSSEWQSRRTIADSFAFSHSCAPSASP